MRRFLAIGLVSALALALQAWGLHSPDGKASAEASCATGGEGRMVTDGDWTVISPPPSQAGSGEVGLFGINPVSPQRIFASDGMAVMRSPDGGCTWERVFDAARGEAARPPAPPSPSLPGLLPAPKGDPRAGSAPAAGDGAARVVAVAVAASGSSDEHVYLLIYRGLETFSATPIVVRSTDGGATWRASRQGLPDATRPPETGRCGDLASCRLVPAPGDPSVLYYVHAPPAGPGEVYASQDGGDTWDLRATPPAGALLDELLGPGGPQGTGGSPEGLQDTAADLDLAGLAVDPLDSQALWALGARGSLSRSPDGGRSWEPIALPTVLEDPRLLDVAHVPGSEARILFFDGAGEGQQRHIESRDGGETFRTAPARGLTGVLASVAHGASPNAVMVATSTGIFRYEAQGRRFSDVDSLRLSPVSGAQADRAGKPAFYFSSAKGIAVFRGARAATTRAGGPSLPGGRSATGQGAGPAGPGSGGKEGAAGTGLSPARIDLSLAPGESRTVSYELSSLGQGGPLDIFFLTDTSGSMSGAIDSLAEGLAEIVEGLGAAGVDAHFGLGEFSESVRYRRIRDIGPPDEEFADALAGLQTEQVSAPGGGPSGVGGEPNLTALHQMATGAGLSNPRRGPPVPPGRGASFRDGSLRAVVHLADENFYHDPDGPSRGQAVAALLARNVVHLGVQIVHDDGPGVPSLLSRAVPAPLSGSDRLRAELADLSAATGAFAPEGGVDCEGDGDVDIPAGAPLVCAVADEEGERVELAGPLARMLASIAEESVVDLVASRASGVEVTVAGRHLSVNLRQPQRLGWDVTFTCRSNLARASSPIALAAIARAQTLASALANVVCGGQGALTGGAPLTGAAAAAAPPPAPAAAPPAPPPQAPLPQVQPGLVGAAVYAPQHELQVARSQAGGNENEEERRFTRATGRRTLPAGLAARLAGAAALTLAAGVALARRERLQPVRALRSPMTSVTRRSR